MQKNENHLQRNFKSRKEYTEPIVSYQVTSLGAMIIMEWNGHEYILKNIKDLTTEDKGLPECPFNISDISDEINHIVEQRYAAVGNVLSEWREIVG